MLGNATRTLWAGAASLALMACGDPDSVEGDDGAGTSWVDAGDDDIGDDDDDDDDDDGDGDGDDDDDDDDDDDTPLPCSGVPTFEDGVEPTQEVHVAPSGADGNGCGGEGSPCASLDFAVSQAGPGTAIRLHEGTYAGGAWIAGLHGSADAPIWIGGVEGEARPVFDGGIVAFTLSAPRYVVVHDIEIHNSEANGINVDDNAEYDNVEAAQHVVFRDLLIHDIGTGGNNDCLKLSGLDEFFVLDSDMSGCGGGLAGSGIDMVGCHDGVVAGNRFHDSPEGGNAVQTKGGSARVVIHGNRFVNAGSRAVNAGGSTDPEYYRPSLQTGGAANAEAQDIVVMSNLFVGSDAAVAFVGCVGCTVTNNTIVDPARWVFRILQEAQSSGTYTFTAASDGEVINNLVYFARGGLSTTVNVGEATMPETFTFSNNLWYAWDSPGQSDPSGELPSGEAAGVYGVDPEFVDPGGEHYGVAASSPAMGAGMALPAVTGDIDGACFGDPPTIGAWASTP